MGELSNIDSDKIVSCAGRMETEVSNVQNGITAFREAITKLDSTWVSENKSIFMQSYERDSEAMTEMVDQMYEICESLKTMAKSFDESENNIAGKISSLR